MTLRPLILAALLLAGTTVASCGKQGDLEQPAPLFGAKAKADYEAKQKEKAEAKAAKKADDADPYQSRPVEAPSAITEPNNPGAGAPQGVLPDPLAQSH